MNFDEWFNIGTESYIFESDNTVEHFNFLFPFAEYFWLFLIYFGMNSYLNVMLSASFEKGKTILTFDIVCEIFICDKYTGSLTNLHHVKNNKNRLDSFFTAKNC